MPERLLEVTTKEPVLISNVGGIKLDRLLEIIPRCFPFIRGEFRGIGPITFEKHSLEPSLSVITQTCKIDEGCDQLIAAPDSLHDRNDLFVDRRIPLDRFGRIDCLVGEENEDLILPIPGLDVGLRNDGLHRLNGLINRPIVGSLIRVLTEGAEVGLRRSVILSIGHVAITSRDVLDRIVPIDHQRDDRRRDEKYRRHAEDDGEELDVEFLLGHGKVFLRNRAAWISRGENLGGPRLRPSREGIARVRG